MVFAARNSSKEMKLMRISRRLRRLEELNTYLITTTTTTTIFHKFGGIIECTYVLSLLFTFRESVESAKNKNIDRSTQSAEDWV
jgi:hypothetical protein